MEEEQEEAVEKTKEECYEISLEEMRKCEEKHVFELEKLKLEIQKKDDNYADLKVQLSQKDKILRKTETKFLEVTHEFQKFIDLTKGFSKGQSEYLLPDINLLQDMLKGAASSCKT